MEEVHSGIARGPPDLKAIAGGAAVENVLIDGNKIRGYNFGGLFQPGSSGVYWTKTNEVAGATYPVYNQGSGNTVES